MKKFVCLIAVFLLCSHLSAREYHVSVKGKDTNVGSLSAPLRTIQAAADKAMPGDVITVHEGIYRERVVPPRGGESDEKRIIIKLHRANGWLLAVRNGLRVGKKYKTMCGS